MRLGTRVFAVSASVAALLLGGCVSTSSSNTYSRNQSMQEMSVQFGQVESVRSVTIEGSRSGVGMVAGGAIGGIAGSNIGRGRGAAVGTIAGAVGGAMAGRAIEESTTRQAGQEITVRLDNGSLISVVQADEGAIRQGDRVRVLRGRGGETRVVRD